MIGGLIAVIVIILIVVIVVSSKERFAGNLTTGGNNPQWWHGGGDAGFGSSIDSTRVPGEPRPYAASASDLAETASGVCGGTPKNIADDDLVRRMHGGE